MIIRGRKKETVALLTSHKGLGIRNLYELRRDLIGSVIGLVIGPRL